jgi:lipopolysaccharide assembly outer membrane protein LptD (OstA)
VRGGRIERSTPEKWIAHDAAITTCDLPNPHYHLRAREIEIYPGDKIIARSVKFVVGDRAFFWLPVVRRSIDDESSNFEVVPGYSSRFGGYLLTAYNFLLGDAARATAHFDYRSKRGFGGGADLRYRIGDTGEGFLTGYYASDDDPVDDDDVGEDITRDRYRVRLDHRQTFTDTTYGFVTLNKLSDPDVLEDFFEREFRYNVQPDSRANVTHFGETYTVTGVVRPKLNDFYTVVERLPAVSLDFRRMRIGETPLFYDSESSVGWLERDFADGIEDENYDSARVDSAHEISLPRKLFGWLSVVPSVQARGTYYSQGLDRFEVEEPIETTADDDPTFIATPDAETFRTRTVTEEGDEQTRWLISPRLRTFFKAFRVWETTSESWDVDGLRHVVQPSVDYYYTNEPDVTPDELPQFDNVDLLTGENFVRLGLRNKLQTRRRGGSHDLVDFFVGTDYRLDPEEDQEDFSSLIGDLELRPLDTVYVDFDTRIDMYEPEIREFNTEFRAFSGSDWDARFSHRYRLDARNLLQTDLRYKFSDLWAVRMYHRYEADDATLEEQEYTVYRDLHCWTSALSVRYRDRREDEDEVQLWLVLAIKAFPERSIKLGQ